MVQHHDTITNLNSSLVSLTLNPMTLHHPTMYSVLTTSCRLYIIAILGLFFCVADQALGHYGLLPASPTILCLILLSPFCFERLLKHCIEPSTAGPLRIIIGNASALFPFALVALVAIALSSLAGTYWEEGGKWVFLVPYGLCITCAATVLGRHQLLASTLPMAILISLGLLAWSIWYDTIYPGTFAPITNRAAGFPGNANFAALVAVMLCAGGLRLDHPKNQRPPAATSISPRGLRDSAAFFNMLLIVLTFAIVCMTMSRSGLVNFSLLMTIFLLYRFACSTLSAKQRTMETLCLFIAALVALGFVVTFSQISTSTQSNSRLSRFLNNQRVDDGSAGTRLMAVKEAINLIEVAPILGHGTGFARTMSELPHNIYLQQWVNNGLPGLLSYAAFLVATLLTFARRGSRNGVALIAVASIGGIFSHNILDQRPFLILLGVLLGASQGDRRAQGIVWSHALLRIAATRPPAPASAAVNPATAP